MTRRSWLAGLLMFLLPSRCFGAKKARRVLVVRAKNEVDAEAHARRLLDQWHPVGARRFWPERIVSTFKVGTRFTGQQQMEFRYTMEGQDGGEIVEEVKVDSWWDYE